MIFEKKPDVRARSRAGFESRRRSLEWCLLRGVVAGASRGPTSPFESCRHFGPQLAVLSRAFAGIQLALSFLLLVGAGLVPRSFYQLVREDLGFKPDNVVSRRVELPTGTCEADAPKSEFYRRTPFLPVSHSK
jgi:hypothetical protein